MPRVVMAMGMAAGTAMVAGMAMATVEETATAAAMATVVTKAVTVAAKETAATAAMAVAAVAELRAGLVPAVARPEGVQAPAAATAMAGAKETRMTAASVAER